MIHFLEFEHGVFSPAAPAGTRKLGTKVIPLRTYEHRTLGQTGFFETPAIRIRPRKCPIKSEFLSAGKQEFLRRVLLIQYHVVALATKS